METIAWIGSLCLALCGLPMAIEAFKNKRIKINGYFLLLWFIGEVATLIYVVYKREQALSLNYISNIIFILVILKYRIN